jgi:hypothetical protein
MGFYVLKNNITVTRFDYGVDIIWNLRKADGSEAEVEGYEVQVIIKKDLYMPDSAAIYDEKFVVENSCIRMPLEESLTSNTEGTYAYAIRLIEDGVFVDTLIQAQFIISKNTFSEAANV